MNAAKDATDLIAKLRVFHNAALKADDKDTEKKALIYSGLDLMMLVFHLMSPSRKI